MIAAMIGIILQIVDDGPTSLTAFGFYFTFGSFIFAAICHPQEFMCLLCLPVYYATIPSMYMVLMLYAIFNINDVSWGTREGPKSAEDKKNEEEEKKAKAKSGVLGFVQSKLDSTMNGSLACVCCGNEDKNEEKLDKMTNTLGALQKSIQQIKTHMNIMCKILS